MAQSFLFYDLETFGLDSRADRIAQAALVRTDMNLRIIDDPVVLLCRIAPDYLPSPASCLVTGITPQQTLKDGVNEFDFIRRLNDEFMVPGTCALGFNNIAFDDEFIRNCLYRNLMDPYEREYAGGNSRWDVLDLVRAVHDFRPDGIKFNHKKENGATSFRLVHLTEDNNIPQEGAHDALVDVYATINVTKLIKEKKPDLFNYYFTHRDKKSCNAMLDVMRARPVMYTSQIFTSPNGSSRPIFPLLADRSRSNTVLCADLTKDARALLSDEESFRGTVRVTTNRCPYLAPVSLVTSSKEVQERLKIDLALMDANISFIKEHRLEIQQHFASIMKTGFPEDQTTDAELRIYMDSFYSDNDRVNMKLVNSYPPERKLRMSWHFDSGKVPKLLFRQVARNWPEVLNENERILWKNYCATRLLQPFNRNPDYKSYMGEINEKLASIGTTGRDKLVLVALREYGARLFDEVMH